MGMRRKEILQTARDVAREYLSAHPVLESVWDQAAVVLAGSGAAEYADRFSGIDLVVLVPDGPQASAIMAALAAEAGQPDRDGFITLSVGSRRIKLTVTSWDAVREELEAYDDYALLTYPAAPVVHDPMGRYPKLVEGFGAYPPDVLARRLADRYRRFRRRRAAIAWNLRRGQPFALLGNLTQALDHALSIGFLLDGRPPAGRKWLLQEGLRTAAGRTLRPVLFDLFSHLGDLATLGGTLNPRRNSLYIRLSRLQAALEEAMAAAGHDRAVRAGRSVPVSVPDGDDIGSLIVLGDDVPG